MSENTNLIEVIRDEMRGGFMMVADEIRQTNGKLDVVTGRLDTVTDRLDTLEKTVANKMDGISEFLLKSEHFSTTLSTRLEKVERRVDKLEKRDKSA